MTVLGLSFYRKFTGKSVKLFYRFTGKIGSVNPGKYLTFLVLKVSLVWICFCLFCLLKHWSPWGLQTWYKFYEYPEQKKAWLLFDESPEIKNGKNMFLRFGLNWNYWIKIQDLFKSSIRNFAIGLPITIHNPVQQNGLHNQALPIQQSNPAIIAIPRIWFFFKT